MAIVFNKVARKSPKDKSVKYYITPKTIKLVGLRDIAKLVAENTTMSPQEVELVLNSFVNKLQETLLNSYSVRLGDWASFHVTCSSKGASTAKDCKPELIKNVRVRCDFTPEFKEKMQKAQWVDAATLHTTDTQE